MQVNWKSVRPLLALFWVILIGLLGFGSYLSLERRYEKQNELMQRALILQNRLSLWRQFLDKEPKEKASEQWIYQLEELKLMAEEKASLVKALAHPLVLDEKAVSSRIKELDENKINFKVSDQGHFTLKKSVDLSREDLENLLVALENEMAKAPFEILQFHIERSSAHLEGEVFELKQLKLHL